MKKAGVMFFLLFSLVFIRCSKDVEENTMVIISSEPEGAEIYLDGEDTEMKTDTVLTDVPSGFHTITLKMEGYPAHSKEFTIDSGDTVSIEFSFASSFIKVFNFFGEGKGIIPLIDSSYIITGEKTAYGCRRADVWCAKIDKYGKTIWEKTYGGGDEDSVHSIVKTSDDGFILVGNTYSYSNGGSDVYLIKIDKDGNLLWEKNYGSEEDDGAYGVVQIDDGYIITGYTRQYGWYAHVWIIKIDQNGNKIWEKHEGEDGFSKVGYAIKDSRDGDFIIAGSSFSYTTGEKDVYLLKIDKDGNKIWERTYGGSDYDCAYSIIETSDNEFVIAGYTYSYGDGAGNIYIIKVDKDGNKIKEDVFTTGNAKSICKSSDGGYAITGTGMSNLIKIDCDMKVEWERYYDGSFNSIEETYDNGYIITGKTWLDEIEGNGVVIIKTNQGGDVE